MTTCIICCILSKLKIHFITKLHYNVVIHCTYQNQIWHMSELTVLLGWFAGSNTSQNIFLLYHDHFILIYMFLKTIWNHCSQNLLTNYSKLNVLPWVLVIKKKLKWTLLSWLVILCWFSKNLVSMYFQKLHEISENFQFTQDHFQLTYFKAIYCTFFASWPI